jgi:hypothetical protein
VYLYNLQNFHLFRWTISNDITNRSQNQCINKKYEKWHVLPTEISRGNDLPRNGYNLKNGMPIETDRNKMAPYGSHNMATWHGIAK